MNRELLEEKLKNREQLILQQNEKISALEKEINEIKIKCVNKHADSERLIEWIKDSEKKPANTAFTEGPDRQLAYYFERLEQENTELRAGLERIRDHQGTLIMGEKNLSTTYLIADSALAKYPKKEPRSVMGEPK